MMLRQWAPSIAIFLFQVALLYLIHWCFKSYGLAPSLRTKRKPHWCYHCKDAADHRTRQHQTALMRRVS